MGAIKEGRTARQSRASSSIPRARWFVMLGSLLTAVMMGSTVSVLEGYWWEETFRLVYAALAVSTLIEMMLPVRRVYRMLGQLISIAVMLYVLIPIEWISYTPYVGVSELRLLMDNLAGYHPYVEIVAAVWLLYVLFTAWARTRIRIIGFFTLCLLVLVVTDSFTPILLWVNTAVVIFAGLIWLIAEHYARFQHDHPVSWSRLLRYPAQLLLPIVLVLSLVMAAGVFVPEIPPLMKDPYTIWKEAQGESVQSFVGDKGIAPANSSKTSASSGYSRKDNDLGGGFNFDYSPVMTVKSSQKSYWRGETRSLYTGKGWEDSELEKNEKLKGSLSTDSELPLYWDRSAAKTVSIEQQVTMIRKDRFPVLFGASAISSVTSMQRKENTGNKLPGLSWGPESMELHNLDGVPYPQSYSIVSEQTLVDDSGIHKARAEMPYEVWQKEYTQLPDTMPDRVKELALSLAAQGGTDYDKAKSIEYYLKTNYPYTNQPDLSKKVSSDFVDSFLFEIGEGYCDYYSTAMVVLAREVGLPARWVKGYATGTSISTTAGDMRGAPEERIDNGVYNVRNSDAHSWAEIYFEGYGWIPFEPTAGFSYPYAISTDDSDPAVQPTPEPSAAPTPTPTPEVKTEETSSFSIPPYAYWIMGALLVAALGFTVFSRRQELEGMWRRYRTRSFTGEELIRWETERFIRYARRKGLAKDDHETLREAVERWSAEREGLSQELRDILAEFESAVYSGKPISTAEVQRYSEKIRHVRGQLRKPR